MQGLLTVCGEKIVGEFYGYFSEYIFLQDFELGIVERELKFRIGFKNRR